MKPQLTEVYEWNDSNGDGFHTIEIIYVYDDDFRETARFKYLDCDNPDLIGAVDNIPLDILELEYDLLGKEGKFSKQKRKLNI